VYSCALVLFHCWGHPFKAKSRLHQAPAKLAVQKGPIIWPVGLTFFSTVLLLTTRHLHRTGEHQ